MIPWMMIFAILLWGLNISNIICASIYNPIPLAVLISASAMFIIISAIQFYKQKILVNQKQMLSLIIFAAIIVIDIYFMIIGLAILIYLEEVSLGETQLSKNLQSLMYLSSQLTFTEISFLNLTFYLGNFIFLGFFIRAYYRMFWVNQIIFIYRYLRKKVKDLNQSLTSNLPLVSVTPQLMNQICALCLQSYELEDQLAKLTCNHIFHKDCIRIWILRSNACALCRKRVMFF